MGKRHCASQVLNGYTAPTYYSFLYGYNLASELTSETYPSGRTISTAYDAAARPRQVGAAGAATPYVTVTSYAPQGGLALYQYGNSLSRQITYNSRLQPYTVADGALQSSTYTWGITDKNGIVHNNGILGGVSITNSGPGIAQPITFKQTFTYDTVNRLSGASDSGGWSRSFGYDAAGNVWVPGSTGLAPPGNTPSSNVFTGANQIGGTPYDSAGNELSVNGNTASYDAENRMVTVTEPASLGGGTETLAYDGLGQRVQKTMPSGTTVYVYDAFGLLAAQYATAATTSLCKTCYLSTDQIGSVRLVTDAAANVIARHDFLPFGNEIPSGAVGRTAQWSPTGDTLNQKFSGQIRDSETGLDFFNARYFAAALGRFTSPDPGNAGADLYNPQSWNGYAYVRNSPLNAVDPTGLDEITFQTTGICGASCFNSGSDSAPIDSWAWWMDGGWQLQNGNHTAGGGGGGSTVTFSTTVTGKTDVTPAGPGPQQLVPGKNCSSGGTAQNLLPHGAGVQLGGEVVFAAQSIGNEAQGNVGGGLFYNEGSGTSAGSLATYGAATRVLPVSFATPKQGPPVMAGAFAGVGFSGFLTNARSVGQLSGPFSTSTLNVGVGPFKFSASLSTGGGIWDIAIGPPFAGVGAGLSVTSVITNTVTSSGGCH